MGGLMKSLTNNRGSETDELQSRNAQSKLKSGVGKTTGVSMKSHARKNVGQKTREQNRNRQANDQMMKNDVQCFSDNDSMNDSERTMKPSDDSSRGLRSGNDGLIRSSDEIAKKVEAKKPSPVSSLNIRMDDSATMMLQESSSAGIDNSFKGKTQVNIFKKQ